MTIKDFYTATTAEPGDIFVCVVTCHISEMGYKLYRCEFPPDMYEGIPQGGAIDVTDNLVKHLFPIVANLNIQERF